MENEKNTCISGLLRNGAIEKDDELSQRWFLQAMSILQEGLSHGKKDFSVFDDRELSCYLMITEPLFGRSITLIFDACLDHYKGSVELLTNLLNAGTFIGKLADKLDEPSPEDSHVIQEQRSYNQKIHPSFLEIKTRCLTSISSTLTPPPPSVPLSLLTKVLHIFISCSSSASLLSLAASLSLQTCRLFGDPFTADNFSDSINTALIAKYHLLARRSEEERRRVLRERRSLMRSSSSWTSKVLKSSKASKTPKTAAVLKKSQEEIEGIKEDCTVTGTEEEEQEEQEEEEEESQDDGLRKFAEMRMYVDELLVNNSLPKYSTYFPMINFFRKEEYLEMLLDFIFFPTKYAISSLWIKKYPKLDGIDVTLSVNKHLATKINTSLLTDETRDRLSYYYLRSRRVAESLSQATNFCFIMRSNQFYIDSFFKIFYSEVITKDCSLCNIGDVCRVILFLFEEEPYIAQSYFLMYNLPYYLFTCFQYSEAIDLLLATLGPKNPLMKCSQEIAERFWLYYRESDFLSEISNILFTGGNIDKYKLSKEYEPIYLGDFEKMIIKFPEEDVGKQQETHKAEKELVLIEVSLGIRKDVDLLFDIIRERRSSIENPISPTKLMQAVNDISLTSAKGKSLRMIRKGKVPKLQIGKFPMLPRVGTSRNNSQIEDSTCRSSNVMYYKDSDIKKIDLFTEATTQRDYKKLPRLSRLSSQDANISERNDSRSRIIDGTPVIRRQRNVPSTHRPAPGASSSRNNDSTSSNINSGSNRRLNVFNSSARGRFYRNNRALSIDDQALKTQKRAILNKTYIIPNLVKNFNTNKIEELYPTEEVISVTSEIEELLKSLNIPSDLYYSENKTKTLAIFFENVFNQIEIAESQSKVGIVYKPKLEYRSLVSLLFERNNFEIYENIFKTFLLRVGVFLNPVECSSIVCGEIICKLHSISGRKNSVFAPYLKRFTKVTYSHFFFIEKLLISFYAKENTSEVKSHNLEVKQPAGRAIMLVTKLLLFLVENQSLIKKDVLDKINETLWDVIFKWFFKFSSNNMLSCVIVQLIESLLRQGSKEVVYAVLFQNNILQKMIDELESISLRSRTEIVNNQALIVSNIKRIILSIQATAKVRIYIITKKREDLKDLINCINTLRSYEAMQRILNSNKINVYD